MDFILRFDTMLLDTVQQYMRHPFLDFFFIFITRLDDLGLVWILPGIFLLCMKQTRKCGIAVLTALAISVTVGSVVLKPIFERVRPFIANEFHILIPPPTRFSFPSSHALTSFAAAAAIFIFHRKYGMIAYILAFLIAFSRIYLYVHYPTDVMAGILLGTVIGLLTGHAVKRCKSKKAFHH